VPNLRRRRSRRVVPVVLLALLSLIAVAGRAQSGTRVTRPSESTPATAMPSPFTTLQQQFVRVVKTVSPQVVQIQSQVGLGSGIVSTTVGTSSRTPMSSRAPGGSS
jgi:hypothetical protein